MKHFLRSNAPARAQSASGWPNNVVNTKGLRKTSAPYIFIWVVYYAWVVVFTTWWTASPSTDNLFNTDMRTIIHAVNLICSALLIFAVKKRCFVLLARVAAALLFVTVAAFIFVPNAAVHLIAAIGMGMALAGVNVGILIPFVFMMNNTEKFYSVVGSYVLINLFALFFEGGTFQTDIEVFLALAVLAASLSALLFFKKADVPRDEADGLTALKHGDHSKIYLTTLLSTLVAILYKGAGKAILNITAETSAQPVLLSYCIGGLLGCLVFFVVYMLNKGSVHFLLNVPFGCLAMGLLCNAFSDKVAGLASAFAVLIGVGSTIGMINMYYMLGVIGKKYHSMAYLRWTLLIVGVCGGVSGVLVGNFINNTSAVGLSIAVSIISVAAMMLFLILNPVLAKIINVGSWDKDSEKMEVTQDHIDIIERSGLSKREKEVVALLLQALTARQISAELGIRVDTTNYHIKNLYRKLGINSKVELFARFGVKLDETGKTAEIVQLK